MIGLQVSMPFSLPWRQLWAMLTAVLFYDILMYFSLFVPESLKCPRHFKERL